MDLGSFDPFATSTAVADNYKTVALKVSNVLMASDGYLEVDAITGYAETLDAFANALIEAHTNGRVLTCLTKILSD